jgi:hypothetical protein
MKTDVKGRDCEPAEWIPLFRSLMDGSCAYAKEPVGAMKGEHFSVI